MTHSFFAEGCSFIKSLWPITRAMRKGMVILQNEISLPGINNGISELQ